jgi:diguanylate cyclase (GGDEF)-like protein/PAS domain S-box-containing protein
MTIRALFYVLLGVFALISAGAGLIQVADSRDKAHAVEWIHKANRLADVAHLTSARLAMERGVTAAILASPREASPGLQAEMLRLRASVDGFQAQMMELAQELHLRADNHPVFAKIDSVHVSRATMEAYRAQVDEQLRGVWNSLDAEQWIALMTRRIADLQSLSAIAMLPLGDNVYTLASGPVIKDVLFTLSEYLGRERAAVGVAIARGMPLSESELRILGEYRSVAVRTRERVESILEHLPTTPALERARQIFVRDMLQHYEELRADVYASSAARRPYPVDAEQWYRSATVGIDSVLGLSAAVSDQFERDIERLRSHAVGTMILLVALFALLLALFAAAVYTVRKRVLGPLKSLERAAATISRGDLSQPLALRGNDELGKLARSFENMRQMLLADIEQRDADARELRKLYALIEQSASAMIITDADGIIEYTNTRFGRVTGYAQDEAIGRKAGFWRSGMTSSAQYREMWNTALQGRVWEGELINRRKNGELYWASVSLSPVLDENGAITHIIGIQHDISERRRIEERLNFLSSYDELTHLPNRSLLAERYMHACAQALANGTLIALVSLGISRFKRINDSLGRDVGDQLLKEIGQRLTECARAHDTVSRHGGTEFTMIVTQLTQLDDIQEMLARVIDAVNAPMFIKGEKLQPTVNAGVSVMPRDGEALDVLLRKATIALHHAERQGLTHCVYTESLDREAQERLSLENALRLSLEREGLELHYQPKVDLATGRIMGVEALARWQHPSTGEQISPQRFIPIAEESGLIQHLGAWALRQACRQNRAWQDAGLSPIVVAVNLSAAQLRQPDLVDSIAGILAETGLDAAWLELELTESALMDDPDHANVVLNRLKGLGLRLAIDDFGTGYSSLSYLSQFPVDQLKIDASFVKEIDSDATAAAISTSVIALAHQMGLKVIAEGVETEAQLAFLNRHGCDEIQGYYFSRPIPAAAFAVLLSSDKQLVSPGPRFPSRSLLVVDDEPAVLAMISLALEDEDYRVLTARSAREALELLASNVIQVVLTDERMPEMSGAEFLGRVRTLYPDTVRIVLSGCTHADRIMDAINTGAVYKFFTKPWDEAHLRAQILEAFGHQEVLTGALEGSGMLTRPAHFREEG